MVINVFRRQGNGRLNDRFREISDQVVMQKILDVPGIGLLLRYAKIKRILGRIKNELAMSDRELRSYQLQRLKIIVAYAYKHIPLYRRKWDAAGIRPDDLKALDDLGQFPVISKDDYRNMTLENAGFSDAPPPDGYLFKTSGSTGVPINIVYNRERGFYEIAAMSNHSLNLHLKTDLKKGMIIALQDDDAIEILPAKEFPGAKRFVVDALDSPEYHVKQINCSKPDYLVTYPSVLKNIAMVVREQKTHIHQPGILITTGESHDAHTRKVIQTAFAGDVLDCYASTELGVMGIECPQHNGLHVLSYKTIIEIVDDDGNLLPSGQSGNVIATDLHNMACPIIRYAGMGDVSGYRVDPCDCHMKNLPLLAGMEGRKVDAVVLPGNRVIHPFKLTVLMRDVPDVRKFQIRQEKKDEIRVLIVKEATQIPGNIAAKAGSAPEKLKGKFQSIVGHDVKVLFEYVSDIPRMPHSHKFQTVVSLIRE